MLLLCFVHFALLFFLGDAEATAFVKCQKIIALDEMHAFSHAYQTSGLYWMLNEK